MIGDWTNSSPTRRDEIGAYERLIGDAMNGDPSLFARTASASWRGRSGPEDGDDGGRIRAGLMGAVRIARADRTVWRMAEPERARMSIVGSNHAAPMIARHFKGKSLSDMDLVGGRRLWEERVI